MEECIKDIIENREIQRLVHFTRIENIPYILNEFKDCNSSGGIYATSFIENNYLKRNDSKRYDGYKNCICTSISYPNIYFFYKLIKNEKDKKDWVIFEISPNVLCDIETSVCKVNAATRKGEYIRKTSIESFQECFSKKLIYYNSEDKRFEYKRGCNIPKNIPTHLQAEVLVKKEIPKEYIKGMIFYDRETAILEVFKMNLLGVNLSNINIKYSEELFTNENEYKEVGKRITTGSKVKEINISEEDLEMEAIRPVFFCKDGKVKKKYITFTWHPGFSLKQKRKSINSFHENMQKKINDARDFNIIEISSKSENELGQKAGAFSLSVELKGKKYTVEQLFQASKVFKHDGKQSKLLNVTPKKAKKVVSELNEKDELIEFNWFGRRFPLEPKTFFYNWLYVHTMYLNKEIAKDIKNYNYFTDIEFNDKKSFNCQAQACALYKLLDREEVLLEAIKSEGNFKKIVYDEGRIEEQQSNGTRQMELL